VVAVTLHWRNLACEKPETRLNLWWSLGGNCKRFRIKEMH